jgi:hypothetical protein
MDLIHGTRRADQPAHVVSAPEGRSDEAYAFIALQRVGGVMAFDITHPTRPEFVMFINNRTSPSQCGTTVPRRSPKPATSAQGG